MHVSVYVCVCKFLLRQCAYVWKPPQFEESMMVFDACRLIRERVPDAVQGQRKCVHVWCVSMWCVWFVCCVSGLCVVCVCVLCMMHCGVGVYVCVLCVCCAHIILCFAVWGCVQHNFSLDWTLRLVHLCRADWSLGAICNTVCVSSAQVFRLLQICYFAIIFAYLDFM